MEPSVSHAKGELLVASRFVRAGFAVAFFAVLLLRPLGAAAACTFYVSPSGASPDVTLAYANANLDPGETACLRPGVYVDQKIFPARSGNSGAPIRYQKDPESTGDVVFEASSAASTTGLCADIRFDWIHISGITCDGRGAATACDGTSPAGPPTDVWGFDIGFRLVD